MFVDKLKVHRIILFLVHWTAHLKIYMESYKRLIFVYSELYRNKIVKYFKGKEIYLKMQKIKNDVTRQWAVPLLFYLFVLSA